MMPRFIAFEAQLTHRATPHGEPETYRSCLHILAHRISVAIALGLVAAAAQGQQVTGDRLVASDQEPQNWLTYYGNYQGLRYSKLDQINAANVGKLQMKWAFLPGMVENFQATPLVVDGTMYLVGSNQSVFALDATNGQILWRYDHKAPDKPHPTVAAFGLRSGNMRGLAAVDDRVILTTNDGRIVALEAKTGTVLWNNKVADDQKGEGFSSPAVVVHGKAIAGIATGEFPRRAFIAAWDVKTGAEVWKFYTVPGPGEPGNETWTGDSWKYGCGAAWIPGTYDPKLNAIYFGTGNPCPMWSGGSRTGDNLFTNSIVALDPDTGTKKWHFQVVPHDLWDVDAIGEPMLVDTSIAGKQVKLALHASKHGYLYALDRETGRFLYAKAFSPHITWSSGVDPQGRPIPANMAGKEAALLCPSATGGAKSWHHMAYSPQTELVYLPVTDTCDKIKLAAVNPEEGKVFMGGEWVGAEGKGGMIVAIDAKTGETVWTHPSERPIRTSSLATAGGVLFSGDMYGHVIALDAKSGKDLWTFHTGSVPMTSMTYSVNGKQYVATSVGWGGVDANFTPYAIPELATIPRSAALFVFGLPE